MSIPVTVIVVVAGVMAILLTFKALTALTRRRNDRSPEEVAEVIENFLVGGGDSWDWDEFLTLPIKDDVLDEIRRHCAQLPQEYPPERIGERYCNEKGDEILWNYVQQLRSKRTLGTN